MSELLTMFVFLCRYPGNWEVLLCHGVSPIDEESFLVIIINNHKALLLTLNLFWFKKKTRLMVD